MIHDFVRVGLFQEGAAEPGLRKFSRNAGKTRPASQIETPAASDEAQTRIAALESRPIPAAETKIIHYDHDPNTSNFIAATAKEIWQIGRHFERSVVSQNAVSRSLPNEMRLITFSFQRLRCLRPPQRRTEKPYPNECVAWSDSLSYAFACSLMPAGPRPSLRAIRPSV